MEAPVRPANAIETTDPCSECKGTGHSGNLHDETCSACDGGGRRWVRPGGSDEDLPAHTLAERQWQDDLAKMRQEDADRRWIDTDREWS